VRKKFAYLNFGDLKVNSWLYFINQAILSVPF
jgi:hypothetical protein